jgi:selenocysteine lyase/cysteine desulfurase
MLETPIADEAAAEIGLLAELQDGLSDIPGVTVHGPKVESGRAPTVVFTVARRDSLDVARSLAQRRIAVWSGDNYACELVDALGLRGRGEVVRAGIVRYTTSDDVRALVEALADLGPRQ